MTYSIARKRSVIVILAAAALVAACHHHDDDNNNSSMPPPTGNTPPPAVTDAFVSYVSQVVATQSDTTEPAATDGVTVTTPEDVEPIALTGP
ncbi:hypothetical protein [Massilia putida]|uniref:hypothetical protein n=1 Tax=Massilia putida TaxID=1141883 RepID=UPI0012EC819E|nr:hypothetical protein [Massilia putida]